MEENNLVNYEGIDLLIKILNKSDKDNKVKKNIENLDNIVNTKFKKLLNFSNILPANIFFDVQNLNLDLKEFSIYPKIFGKNSHIDSMKNMEFIYLLLWIKFL